MKTHLYKFQKIANKKTREFWSQGARSVLLVGPPGSGKTEMGMGLVWAMADIKERKGKALWVVHTRDLMHQAATRLRAEFGGGAVSVVAAGHNETPGAWIHVGIVHSLLEHPGFDGVELVVLDEAHHYLADEWAAVREKYGAKARELGLTATPERQDGRALGDIFQQLVVAAKYSELIAAGHLVPARVIQPCRDLGSQLAQHPVDAWADYSEGGATFAFYPLVQTAEHYAREFLLRGISSLTVHGDMPRDERAEALESFELGKTTVLSTVNTMIEGVNVPAARVALLARKFDFIGLYLQATGRVHRSSEGKPDAIIIDLTGASIRHGSPVQDRDYSLEGRAISGGGGPGGEGGGGAVAPEVVGVSMRLAERGALPQGAPLPPPIALSEPDAKLAKRVAELRRATRAIRTKHGRRAAELYAAQQGRFQ